MTDTTTRYKFAPVANHEMVDHSKFVWSSAARASGSRIKQLIAKRKPKVPVQLEFQFGGRK